MKLIYPLFPLLGQGNSPQWCSDVVQVADQRGDVVYDIRVPFRQQSPALLEHLTTKVLKPSLGRRLRAILGHEEAQDLSTPLHVDHLRLFDADHLGPAVVARDLYVLARADIVIVDANVIGYGEHMVTATYAHLLGCHVIVVNDQHICSPFLGEIASVSTVAAKVTALIGPKRRPQPPVTPTEIVESRTVDPFDDGTG